MPRPPHQVLKEAFDFPSFRGQQRQVIEQLIGGGDALVVMATGEGKSLCFQIPALAQDGLTIVVSPLIALMEDQVQGLVTRGLPATCLHSNLSGQERAARLAAVEAGDVRLLYCTPERFRVPGVLDRLAALDIDLLAIDEAHCVSQWGHDFRPDYRRLGQIRRALGNPPCGAFTATATPQVQEDIRASLDLGDAPLFQTGIERDNLFLEVSRHTDDASKLERVLELLPRIGAPAIVYCALIRDLLRLEDELLRRGMHPIVYHGKLSGMERREQQREFLQGPPRIVLATNAFGMGVDKADIRGVIHFQVPGTLEAYYQEIGRAGRDGQGSHCELLYCEEDLAIQREFTEWGNPDVEFAMQLIRHMAHLGERLASTEVQDLRAEFLLKNRRDGRVDTVLNLLETAGCIRGTPGQDLEWLRTPEQEEVAAWLPDGKREADLHGLLAMARYADPESSCRKQAIHAHFGFELTPPCGSCDRCVDTEEWHREHMPEAATATPETSPAAATAAPVARGQWIDVKGHGLCCVRRVHALKGRFRIDVERARDLVEKSFDLHRIRWRHVEGR